MYLETSTGNCPYVGLQHQIVQDPEEKWYYQTVDLLNTELKITAISQIIVQLAGGIKHAICNTLMQQVKDDIEFEIARNDDINKLNLSWHPRVDPLCICSWRDYIECEEFQFESPSKYTLNAVRKELKMNAITDVVWCVRTVNENEDANCLLLAKTSEKYILLEWNINGNNFATENSLVEIVIEYEIPDDNEYLQIMGIDTNCGNWFAYT